MQQHGIRLTLLLFCGGARMINHPCGLQAAEVPPGVALATVQQLVINNGAEVQSLDPHKTNGASEKNVLYDLFEGLLNLGSQGQVVPGVATHWHASADLKVWTFYLRPEARWS